MIVGIDGRSMLAAKTGIGVYTDRLLRELATCGGLDIKCYLHLPFLNPEKKKKALAEVAQAHPTVALAPQSFPTPKIQRLIWSYSSLMPVEAIIGDIDIFHATSFLMPPLRKAKGVMTIYDLTFMLFPEHHTREMQEYTAHIRTYTSRADCIIAISEHTKQDIVEQLKIPGERIKVTMLAADGRYRIINDPDAISSVKSRLGIEGDYILYTGTLEPRKNVPAIVRAYSLLRNDTKNAHKLVLAGRKGWLYDEILESVRALGLEEDIIFTGYVPDEDMPYLYNGASVFVYPSFYEGFGLPPLEAMACGCPAVTSNTSSLPEVVGDAGLMVDPARPDELAEAIDRILGDSALRSALREKGLKRSAQLSWQRCAAETLSIYRELAGIGEMA